MYKQQDNQTKYYYWAVHLLMLNLLLYTHRYDKFHTNEKNMNLHEMTAKQSRMDPPTTWI